MKKIIPVIAMLFCAAASYAKPTPDAALEMLMKGNERFVAGKSIHPRNTPDRRKLSAVKNQGDYAYATILGCSDSRVPVELIFDAGIMDIFVIRVPGNVFQTDEIAGAEYGVGHVHTPVLMVLGHSDCGAVTATVGMTDKHGHAHKLERNIPALLKPIIPAVAEARKNRPDLKGKALIEYASELNVLREIRQLFHDSAAIRAAIKAGKVKVTGAIYDIASGKVILMEQKKIDQIFSEVEKDRSRSTKEFAD